MKIYTTDTYYNLFNILIDVLDKTPSAQPKNVIFCEEKISLMVERAVCDKLGGTFNTRVYSFGKYLKEKMDFSNALTKEGSVMVIKKLLKSNSFKCFKTEKNDFALTVYNVIRQLKSAKVSPEDILRVSSGVGVLLKNKLEDISKIYSLYENYVKENGLEDQSSILSYLPSIIRDGDDLKGINVYIVGYTSFTAQIREIIGEIIKKAGEVYAILPNGDNDFVFVNETARATKIICERLGEKTDEVKIKTVQNAESDKILKELFSPIAKIDKFSTDKIYAFSALNSYSEMERVAETIKNKVMSEGRRYRDFKVVIPNDEGYFEQTKKAFRLLDVPYFINKKKVPLTHPLVTLIFSYIDALRKNWEKDAVSSFYKNPIFNADKDFTDKFENYLLKNNINYFALKNSFTDGADEETLKQFNSFREKIVKALSYFDVKRLLLELDAKQAVENLNAKLEDLAEFEEKAVGEQIYTAVIGLIDDIEELLFGVELTLNEYKSIFKSGVSAMEISIIPQYNDAVFIGGYHECAVALNPCVFCVGLTSEVPSVSTDVALLTDDDINVLSKLKVLIEPKIKVVNHRTREQTALGIASFSEELYLSYPENNSSGAGNLKSEILDYFSKAFTIKGVSTTDGYTSKAQGLSSFAKDCALFSELKINEIENASCYYKIYKEEAERILEFANSEMKLRLENFAEILVKDLSSATAIEEYNKCPYKYFIEKGLSVKEREEGELSSLSTGILMHEIFCKFIKTASTDDTQNFEQIFSKVKSEILSSPTYKTFLQDSAVKAQFDFAVNESQDFCKKTLGWLTNSKFKPKSDDVEVRFGDGEKYPAVNLGEKVKLSGVIDRIDTFNEYFRIIDYKTGSVSEDDKELFNGTKLQLYLYAKAVKDKELAGLYYLKVDESYKKDGEKKVMATGKTVDDKDLALSQDATLSGGDAKFIPVKIVDDNLKGGITKEALSNYLEYALKVGERAVGNMTEGFIAPTPSEKQCKYCEYASLCQNKDNVRKIKGVSGETFFRQCLEENE